MNTQRLMADISGGVWAMRESNFRAMSKASFAVSMGGAEVCPIAEVEADGILVVHICGTLYRGLGDIGRAFGFIDPDDVRHEIEEYNTPDVAGVLLVVDSPGGGVGGIADLAKVIRTIAGTKPVFAYAAGLCASGAYWVASQASAIYASPSSFTGSIGVYQAITDTTKQHEMMGERIELFKSGPLKAAGLDGTSLTDEQRAAIQSKVDSIYYEFSGAVSASRRVKPEAMTGGDYYGATAKPLGLVDSISDLNTARADLRKFADLRRMKG